MELHILKSSSVALERNHYSNFVFPGWSKTGRRTRPGNALILTPASHRALSASDDEAHDYPLLENGEPSKENLPPKKRKKLITHGNNKRIANPGPESSTKLGKDPCNEIPIRARKHHKCEICDRSFKSYQALGGHKAHHHNNGFRTATEDESLTVYQCPFCCKMFSKGQALGGHKRHCRRRGPENGGGQGPKNHDRVLGFDLNELPPECLDEASGRS